MKIKSLCVGAVALALLLWACWSLAYRRGYSRGALDEFARWKQEPMPPETKVLVGKRDVFAHLAGGKPPDPKPRFRDPNVNNIPSISFP